MGVLLPNTTLAVRPRIDDGDRNAHGERVPVGWGPATDLLPGRTNEQSDGSWNLGVDPTLWPLRMDDLVISVSGGTWLVRTSDLIQNNYDSTVDWIRVTAQRRSAGGTQPGGPWFVARFTDQVLPDPVGPPVAGLFTGHGPPPDDLDAEFGDEYLDLDTGIVYEFGED